MGRINKLMCALLITLCSGAATAQNNTNSPYTRYGLGQLVDQSFSRSKAMGGTAYSLRDKVQINPLNPASYTAMDSLTFVFEGGLSFQNGNYSDGTTKLNAKNSSFDYLALKFRLKKWMAMSAGVLPVSNVGYNLRETNTGYDNPEANNSIVRYGDGGLHQVYLGMGFIPMKNLSVGFNVSYLWGTINNNTEIAYGDNTIKKRYKETSLKGLKLDFGAQYAYQLNETHGFIAGATFSPKMKLGNNIQTRTELNVITIQEYKSSYESPSSIGLGLSYLWKKKLTLAVDYTQQNWDKVKVEDKENTLLTYRKYAVGAEYVPDALSRNYLKTIKYRVGFYYSTPYYKIDDKRAAKEYGLSAGLGLQIPKIRSSMNLSVQYIKVQNSSSDLLKENYFRINLGLIFNERWFVKQKI